MDVLKIKEYIENQFVDDYEDIKKFMDEVNETLDNIHIDQIYLTYNEFCLDIEKSVMETLENTDTELTPEVLISALNNMLKYKIIKDENYEEKIREYFDDPEMVIDDINKLKAKKVKKL